MDLFIAFLLGVVSSATVAAIVYRRQRREALQSESNLLRSIVEQGDRIERSTTMLIGDSTDRLEDAVSVLRRQVMSGLKKSETMQWDHLVEARTFLPDNGRLDERTIKTLHRQLLGEEFEYAGQFRDAPVAIGDGGVARDAIAVPDPAEIHARLRDLVDAWNDSLTANLSRDERLRSLASFHAGFIAIHPFFDGNGLIARVILAIESERVLGVALLTPRRDPTYFSSIQAASKGDLSPLIDYLTERIPGLPGSTLAPDTNRNQ